MTIVYGLSWEAPYLAFRHIVGLFKKFAHSELICLGNVGLQKFFKDKRFFKNKT